MFVLGHLFDCKLPSNKSAQRLNRLEKLVLQKRSDGKPLPVWSPLLFFTAGKSFRRKAVFVLESLFPRPEILRQVFANTPDLKLWQLYLKRALQIVNQAKL